MAETSKESGSLSFWDSLPRFFKHPELQGNFRRTVQGVFVHEAVLDRLLEAYQKWQKEKTEATEPKSLEKCRRRLFGQDSLRLFYVLDGKKCLPGYIAPIDKEAEIKIPIPSYQANLLETENYIHPRDPKLLSLSNIKPIIRTHEGLSLELLVRGSSIKSTEPVLKQFAVVSRRIVPLIEAYPGLNGPMRDHLPYLVDLLNRAQQIPNKMRILIPEQFKGKEVTYLSEQALVFVISNSELMLCYGLNTKNMISMIREELRQFRRLKPQTPNRQKGKQRKQRKQQRQPRGREVEAAFVKAAGRSFRLELRAFLQFVGYAKKSPTLRKQLGQRFTLRDCFDAFTKIFEESRNLESHEVTRLKRQDKEKEVLYRKGGSWFFAIKDNDLIFDCFQRLRQNKPQRNPSR